MENQFSASFGIPKFNNLRNTEAHLSFKPFSNSWVAIHPDPKGVIQFVGSFFIFGSLPTVFYNSLLRSLYNEGYTIIAYPCSVIPPLRWKLKLVDHWKASIRLLKEEYALKTELIAYILNYGNQNSLDVYLNQSNYYWLGHSLGCKYISILEILSSNPQNINANLIGCKFNSQEFKIIEADISDLERERIKSDRDINNLLTKEKIDKQIQSKKSIIDQPSIFIAPEIYGTQDSNGATIPYFKVFPSGQKTLCLIKASDNYFNLTALISFAGDEISEDDVKALKHEFSNRDINKPDKLLYRQFSGYDLKIKLLSSLFSHLRPTSNYIKPLACCIAQMLDELTKRTNSNYKPQQVKCDDFS